MAVHIATPAEIGGSLDTEEVKALHLTGPYQGMLLVNKRTDPTLDDAVLDREVLVERGIGVILPSELVCDVIGVNPPLVYPAPMTITLTGTPTGAGDKTNATVNVNGGINTPLPVTLNGNVYSVEYQFQEPGAFRVRMRLNSGDWGETDVVMQDAP